MNISAQNCRVDVTGSALFQQTALALTCLVYPAGGQIRSNEVCKDAHL